MQRPKMSGLRALELELRNKEEKCKETAPVGLQEGAGGLSFTMVCIPKGMHSHPRVRDDYTAAVFDEKTIAVMKPFYCEC